MPTYRAIQLKGKGGLDQLQEIELPLMAPKTGEIRIRVRASGVGFTDIMKRTGYYPYRPAFPSATLTPLAKGSPASPSGSASAR
jgi:NADPH:quinone reductase-like Zn-dependent oxidoreductase